MAPLPAPVPPLPETLAPALDCQPLAERGSAWTITYSGRPFWPLAARAADIHLVDIAHHLAHLNRFGGATPWAYSVAQHSAVGACALLGQLLAAGESVQHARVAARYFLLHDAAEAYLRDLPRPLKGLPEFQFYRALETELQTLIYRRFGLDPDAAPDVVARMDHETLAAEVEQLVPAILELRGGRNYAVALNQPLLPWTPELARQTFLDLFDALYFPPEPWEGELRQLRERDAALRAAAERRMPVPLDGQHASGAAGSARR